MEPLGDNRVALGGRVFGAPRRRQSPAGIPILQFVLEHASEQAEAGASRPLTLRIAVRASGECAAAASGLGAGEPVRVLGYLARSRQGERPLLISARRIERLADTSKLPGD